MCVIHVPVHFEQHPRFEWKFFIN